MTFPSINRKFETARSKLNAVAVDAVGAVDSVVGAGVRTNDVAGVGIGTNAGVVAGVGTVTRG